jgi:hypothetical protein
VKKLKSVFYIGLSKGLIYVVKINPETTSAKSVSEKLLRSVWKRISDKPLPDVFVYTLEESEFLSALELLQKQNQVIDTRVKEYGVKVDNKFIEACTFKFKGHFVIFVKQAAPLVDALEHELKHIATWNFKDETPKTKKHAPKSPQLISSTKSRESIQKNHKQELK